jgi:hypothetical protein
MDKTSKSFLDFRGQPMRSNREFNKNSGVHIEDKRVAQLLIVLHELDESLGALEYLPKTELSELVASAIFACGFVDQAEAGYAIAAVLETISAPGAMAESS